MLAHAEFASLGFKLRGRPGYALQRAPAPGAG
jgi:hypothetical protein